MMSTASSQGHIYACPGKQHYFLFANCNSLDLYAYQVLTNDLNEKIMAGSWLQHPVHLLLLAGAAGALGLPQ